MNNDYDDDYDDDHNDHDDDLVSETKPFAD